MKCSFIFLPVLFAVHTTVSTLIAADSAAKASQPKAAAPIVYDGNPERRKYELPIEPDENVAYGPHRMQVIYFWRAKSDQPTP
ncbi:MAG: hypothetical protein ACK53L_29650, partial [Pirellulaceae bacterium]